MKRRVVVTGLGAITPIGNSIDSFWNAVKEGKNGIDKITFFDTTDFKVKVAAEVKDFKAEDYLGKKDAKRLDRYTQLALVASKECMKDSNIDLDKVDRERFGVIFGSGIGGLITIENQIRTLVEKGPNRVSPLTIPTSISNIAAGSIAIEFGLLGSCLSVTTACATSTHCIGEAYRSIKDGYLDRAIVGGAEASINEFGIAGFQALTALSKSEDPNRASIPFDKDRNGFVMGEGAGALILEELESALKRGAKIYGEVVGYGTTCDAYHITSPTLDGDGAYRSMRDAMNEANLAKDVYVSSTKSMTGHLLGAAGAVEAIISIKALEDGFIPANINYLNPDEECDLNLVANVGKNEEINYALSNSLGFGGHNGTVIFKKWRGR